MSEELSAPESRNTLDDAGTRTVIINGVNAEPCGGTHVSDLGVLNDARIMEARIKRGTLQVRYAAAHSSLDRTAHLSQRKTLESRPGRSLTRLDVVPSKFTPATKIGLSISVATGLYAISYGALGVAAGLNVWQIAALSLLMFTGGSQFAFIGVIAGGGSPGAAFGAATLLGVRNAVYGMQVKSMLKPRGLKKLLAAQLTIDESTATAAGQSDPAEQKRGFWVAGIGVYLLWNIFTVIGALLGDAMGDPQSWGLDGAAVAAFLGLLWPRLKSSEPIAIASVCALVTVLAVPLVPAGVPILVAAVVAGVWGYFGRGRPDEGLEPDIEPHSNRKDAA